MAELESSWRGLHERGESREPSGGSGPRLPLAIPVFVRSRDGKGKEFLEFATALNVSAGGMLVAIRRVLPAIAQIRLEIPSAPVAALALLPRASRTLRAKALRTTPAEGYYLLGLKFARPLLLSGKSNRPAAAENRFCRVKMFAHRSPQKCYSWPSVPDYQGVPRRLFGKLILFNHII